MNPKKDGETFENLRILLDSECSSTIVMIRLMRNFIPETYAVIKWHTQAGYIATNLKVKMYFFLT